MSHKIRRREFIKLSALGAVGVAAAACAPTPEIIEVTREVEKVVKETVVVETEKEVSKEVVKEVEKQVTVVVEVSEETPDPPMLADMVAAGDLPPLT